MQRPHWHAYVLGGTCVGVAATLFLLRRRAARKNCSALDTAKISVASQSSKEKQQVTSSAARNTEVAGDKLDPLKASESLTWDSLETWAAGLRKRDAACFLTVLEWTERLLDERPEHPALSACLGALSHVVVNQQEFSRVSAVAVKAGTREPEFALEVLNCLFKDRKQRGGLVADAAVVDFALTVLRLSLDGAAQRGVYQRAVRLLDWLALQPQNRIMLVDRGGLDILLQVMTKFVKDPGVLLEGSACIRSMAADQFLNVAKASDVLITCLHKFPDNGQLQWRALAALHALPMPSKPKPVLIAELACAATTRHPRFDSVVEWSAKVLYRLATAQGSGVREWLKDPSRSDWVHKFKKLPRSVRQPNKEVEIWVPKLCDLCTK
eukprot:TRINITY_DN15304_c0_g1_i1.p1 TRINITY_DN15304_c0_g1~~TRINITY_DN15304_c0_g1_i1.p1  ORF type:complete len:381 (+),score=55.86 TRINITY_DN15304_c0_g1_i1:45-1187(+)